MKMYKGKNLVHEAYNPIVLCLFSHIFNPAAGLQGTINVVLTVHVMLTITADVRFGLWNVVLA
jgi:hypothetical protein